MINQSNKLDLDRFLRHLTLLLLLFFLGIPLFGQFSTELFFSEYVEGSSNNKALEIFNGTGEPVDLSAYSVKLGSNGGVWNYTLAMTGTLAHNDVYVIANAAANATILGVADVTSTVTYFNGDDALGLFHGTTLIDVIGVYQNDPGLAWNVAGTTEATLNHTLIRKPTIVSPTTDWAESAGTTVDNSQWIVFPIDYITDLGMHTFTPQTGEQVPAPTFDPPTGLYSTPIQVVISDTNPNAAIYYTTDGTTPSQSSTLYTTPINVNMTTTIKAIAYATGLNPSNIATANYTFSVAVANLGVLRTLPADNTTIYNLTNEVVLTFKQTFRNQKYIQDAFGAVLIDDLAGVITTTYNVGDGITGISGKASVYGGMLQFIPIANSAPATSFNNVIVPVDVTIDDLRNDFEGYESKLIRINNAVFTGATGNFANGTVYVINDQTENYNFRTTFYDVDYIGQPIPTDARNIVGIPNSRTDGDYFTARNLNDFEIPQGNVAPPVFNPPSGTYYSNQTVAMTTATTGAAIYYTLNGTNPTNNSTLYTAPITISSTTTVKAIAYFNGEYSAITTAVYTMPVLMNSIAQLRTQPTGTLCKLTSQAIITFQQTYRNQKYIQDATAAILIDDLAGTITTTYLVGDGVTGFIGTIAEFGGMLEFTPAVNSPVATSHGNAIEPQVITLTDFLNNFENYESELVKFDMVMFTNASGNFANGTVYPLSNGTQSINFRTTFYDVDYIGSSIPTTWCSVVGIPNSRTDGNYFTARYLYDFTLANIIPPVYFDGNVFGGNNVHLIWSYIAPDYHNTNVNRDYPWGATSFKVYKNNQVISEIPVDASMMWEFNDLNVPNGLYSYWVTTIFFNTVESDPTTPYEVLITGNDDQVNTAQKTQLFGNYPNPFNPSTTISYSIKTPEHVLLEIYNMKGQKVCTLVDNIQQNGFYNVVWNGKDSLGKTSGSGVYFYKIYAGRYSSTRKMIMMK